MNAGERSESQLSIGELARCAGVTSRTIRHYHATGLLPEPARDAAGYRRYGPGDLARLLHISRLRALGMPTDEIEQALAAAPDDSSDLPDALLALAVDVDAEIDRLHGVHDRLVTLAASDDLHDAADLLSADLRAQGLLDLEDPSAPIGPAAHEHFEGLRQQFRRVTDEEVEELAQELASILPAPTPPRAVHRPADGGPADQRPTQPRPARLHGPSSGAAPGALAGRARSGGRTAVAGQDRAATGRMLGGRPVAARTYSVSATGSGAGAGPAAEARTSALGTDSWPSSVSRVT